MQNKLKVVTVFLIAIIITGGCGNNMSRYSNAVPNKIDLQVALNNAVNSKEAKEAHLTGILLSFQCNGFNKNRLIFLSSGKLSDKADAAGLPTNAIYQIGSSTKSFVAVVALQLEAEGGFGANGLDTTVGKILGNPISSRTWNNSWNKIPLRQLLNMTSGIPECLNVDTLNIYSESPDHYFSTDELLQFAVNLKPKFAHGQGWEYSNTNYVIMNKIISKVAGSTLKEQITKRIINKLGLTHTYYVDNLPKEAITDPVQQLLLMSGYFGKRKTGVLDYNTDLKLDSFSIYNAAGSMLSNTQDMNRYIRALFADKDGLLELTQLNELKQMVATEDTGKYKAGQLIDVVDRASKTRFGLGYGLGIMEYFIKLSNGNNIRIYSHGGNSLAFSSNWMYLPNQQAIITYVLNSQGATIGALRENLESHIFDKTANDCITK